MEKRTFSEYHNRIFQLQLRIMKIKTKFIIFQSFHPWKALFVKKRFNKIIYKINEMIINEQKKGYWI